MHMDGVHMDGKGIWLCAWKDSLTVNTALVPGMKLTYLRTRNILIQMRIDRPVCAPVIRESSEAHLEVVKHL